MVNVTDATTCVDGQTCMLLGRLFPLHIFCTYWFLKPHSLRNVSGWRFHWPLSVSGWRFHWPLSVSGGGSGWRRFDRWSRVAILSADGLRARSPNSTSHTHIIAINTVPEPINQTLHTAEWADTCKEHKQQRCWQRSINKRQGGYERTIMAWLQLLFTNLSPDSSSYSRFSSSESSPGATNTTSRSMSPFCRW